MARANIEQAVEDLSQLYGTAFGGKTVGRFTVTRDQLAGLMRVKVAHDKTIGLLREAALNDADLVLGQCAGGLYGVVGARKAARWRKLPRATLAALVGATAESQETAGDDETEDGED
ncbi:hypothetical protein [Methylobacterium goesingense]|uniref:Uncharacterized protein n=1 Tax=Methylobacterium goesingense TaxID=243690 RepID=A0ABV2LBW2_9HYPH|nr:hypothetical protein [Methylobacterium goesingense]GJD73606.1 hypothetical protein CFIICLFH_1835 [Methylobacterium goesingense]